MHEIETEDRDGLNTERTPVPITLVCHGRSPWDAGFGRTQHLMSRLASHRRVFFVEPPAPDQAGPRLQARTVEGGVVVVTPCLSAEHLGRAPVRKALLRQLLEQLVASAAIEEHIAWYDSPLPLGEGVPLQPRLTVYDCAEEAVTSRRPAAAVAMVDSAASGEDELLVRADLVFAAGQSLYESRCARHPSVFSLPSAVDEVQFRRARSPLPAPSDQRDIPRPRLGFAGVIDDRVDVDLLAALAVARPDWQIVLAGPVVKRDSGALPRGSNIHYLGPKSSEQLPAYLAGWDVALVPLVRGDATRFLGPGRALESLAAGRPVVATGLRDLRPLSRLGLVTLADGVNETVAAITAALACDRRSLRTRADRALAQHSWDETTRRIAELLQDHLRARTGLRGPRAAAV